MGKYIGKHFLGLGKNSFLYSLLVHIFSGFLFISRLDFPTELKWNSGGLPFPLAHFSKAF